MFSPGSRIIVFAKAPNPGEVKTRLIPDYGEAFATELHCAMLWHSLTVITEANICPIELWCAPDTDHPFFDACISSFDLSLRVQQGNTLGGKLSYAFDQVLINADSALVIGADCPSLKATDFIAAFESLQAGDDVVISPAEDGGYVMLGKSKPVSQLFEHINWGSDAVFKQTIERLKTENLRWNQLETHRDIDLPSDVEYLAANAEELQLHPRLATLVQP